MRCFYTERHRLRDAKTELHGGVIVAPFEKPERADMVLNRWKAVNLGEVVEPAEFGLDPVLRIHDAAYLEFLRTCWRQWVEDGNEGEALPCIWPTRTMNSPHIPDHIEGKLGYYALAGETAISDGTWEAALGSKDVALAATEEVINGARAAFGLCRPPGHHAAADQYGGYCFLNNAAIAAQYARDQGFSKVAILDVDFHHGNGTQDIFYDRDDVLFVSLHGDPMQTFPHFAGHADETGRGAGDGFTVNYPMPPGTPYAIWSDALDQAKQRIADFGAELLVVSLGVDTFEHDPISSFKLKSDDFTDYGQRLKALNMPTVFLMEGGYAVEEIGINAVNVLQGFDAG